MRHRDPEEQRRLLAAILGLRLELLRTATECGVLWLLEAGPGGDVEDWRSWLNWLEGSLTRVRERGTELGFAGMDPGRGPRLSITRLLRLLNDFADGHPVATDATLVCGCDAESALEDLALRARKVEEFRAEPLGEEEGASATAGVALLGAVEDSLVLSLSDDDESRDARVTPQELYELLMAARDSDVWEFFGAI